MNIVESNYLLTFLSKLSDASAMNPILRWMKTRAYKPFSSTKVHSPRTAVPSKKFFSGENGESDCDEEDSLFCRILSNYPLTFSTIEVFYFACFMFDFSTEIENWSQNWWREYCESWRSYCRFVLCWGHWLINYSFCCWRVLFALNFGHFCSCNWGSAPKEAAERASLAFSTHVASKLATINTLFDAGEVILTGFGEAADKIIEGKEDIQDGFFTLKFFCDNLF